LGIDFSPKVNVIIGENGIVKTHLLKAAYSLCAGAPLIKSRADICEGEFEAAITAKLLTSMTSSARGIVRVRLIRPICLPGGKELRTLAEAPSSKLPSV
jgi:recombinational DNA repair ATPase RecF